MNIVPLSRFHRNFLSLNTLEEDFQTWLFLPSMLHDAEEKWWGNGGSRKQRHEGIDIFAWRTIDGNIRYLDASIKIPVVYTGTVEKIIDDFLGSSVFVSHDHLEDSAGRLFTIYGHTKPSEFLVPGITLDEGDIIGTIADTGKSTVRPHLHISIARIPHGLPIDDLNWDTMNGGHVTLIDPLPALNMSYSVIESLP